MSTSEDALIVCMTQGNEEGALDHCMRLELLLQEGDGGVLQKLSESEFYAIFLSCFLIRGDMEDARHLWRRAPAAVKASQELSSLWEVGKCLWVHDAMGAYRALAVSAAISQSMSIWSEKISRSVRKQQEELVSTGYSTIALERLAPMLNMSIEEATSRCQALGWTIEDSFVRPVPSAHAAVTQKDSGKSDMQHNTALIKSMSKYVAQFEVKPIKIEQQKGGDGSSSRGGGGGGGGGGGMFPSMMSVV